MDPTYHLVRRQRGDSPLSWYVTLPDINKQFAIVRLADLVFPDVPEVIVRVTSFSGDYAYVDMVIPTHTHMMWGFDDAPVIVEIPPATAVRLMQAGWSGQAVYAADNTHVQVVVRSPLVGVFIEYDPTADCVFAWHLHPDALSFAPLHIMRASRIDGDPGLFHVHVYHPLLGVVVISTYDAVIIDCLARAGKMQPPEPITAIR